LSLFLVKSVFSQQSTVNSHQSSVKLMTDDCRLKTANCRLKTDDRPLSPHPNRTPPPINHPRWKEIFNLKTMDIGLNRIIIFKYFDRCLSLDFNGCFKRDHAIGRGEKSCITKVFIATGALVKNRIQPHRIRHKRFHHKDATARIISLVPEQRIQRVNIMFIPGMQDQPLRLLFVIGE
jgi:hypothetical protein